MQMTRIVAARWRDSPFLGNKNGIKLPNVTATDNKPFEQSSTSFMTDSSCKLAIAFDMIVKELSSPREKRSSSKEIKFTRRSTT